MDKKQELPEKLNASYWYHDDYLGNLYTAMTRPFHIISGLVSELKELKPRPNKKTLEMIIDTSAVLQKEANQAFKEAYETTEKAYDELASLEGSRTSEKLMSKNHTLMVAYLEKIFSGIDTEKIGWASSINIIKIELCEYLSKPKIAGRTSEIIKGIITELEKYTYFYTGIKAAKLLERELNSNAYFD